METDYSYFPSEEVVDRYLEEIMAAKRFLDLDPETRQLQREIEHITFDEDDIDYLLRHAE